MQSSRLLGSAVSMLDMAISVRRYFELHDTSRLKSSGRTFVSQQSGGPHDPFSKYSDLQHTLVYLRANALACFLPGGTVPPTSGDLVRFLIEQTLRESRSTSNVANSFTDAFYCLRARSAEDAFQQLQEVGKGFLRQTFPNSLGINRAFPSMFFTVAVLPR